MRGVPVLIPSKRDNGEGTGVLTKYYYPNAKEFWADRNLLEWTIGDVLQCADLVEDAAFQSKTLYTETRKELGMTGRSILLRLSIVCGWSMVTDAMFDLMHILLLCMIQNLINLLNTGKDEDGQCILNVDVLKERCKLLYQCWPTECREKRVPRFHEMETKGKLPALKGELGPFEL